MSGERGVEGSRAEGGIAEKTTEPFVGGTMILRRAGNRASKASDGQGAALDDSGAEADEIVLLVSVPGQMKTVDKGAEGANMSMEHGLLLSSYPVHDAPWEKPVLHAAPSCNHTNPLQTQNKPID